MYETEWAVLRYTTDPLNCGLEYKIYLESDDIYLRKTLEFLSISNQYT